MRQQKTVLSALTVALFCLLVAACDNSAKETATDQPAKLPANVIALAPEALTNAGLELVEAGPAEIQQTLRIQGDIKLENTRVASIVARVKGVVRAVKKKMGDRVRKGESLVVIESKELAQAKMAYFETEHRVEFMRKALAREKQLLEKKITSKEKYSEKQHELEEAVLAHAGALQRLKLLGFSEEYLHGVKEDLESNMTRFSLRAPFGGEIIKKSVTLGEALEEEKEVFVVADLSKVWVEANIPVAKLRGLSKGQKVKVFSDKTDKTIEGQLVYIASIADEASRTVLVRVEIDNEDSAWKPGMCARLDFESTPVSVPVSVPHSAIHELDGRPSVFVEQAEGRFLVQPVEVGIQDEERVQIVGGLRASQRVAAANSLSLKAEWLNK